jgi:LmbE family N-acetylglucosaminyl deacetylase
LCLGAHCDDIEIGCGGTILRLVEQSRGLSMHWFVLSSTAERRAEAERSAAAFLAGCGVTEVAVSAFRDGYFPWVGAEIKDYVESIAKRVEPDLVFTHYRDDRHQDHRIVADITWNCFRNHLILEYEVPKYDGDLGRPSLFVPLPERLAGRKVALLLEHYPSQRHRGWFEAATFRGLMRLRGMECNAEDGMAEAFFGRKLVLDAG